MKMLIIIFFLALAFFLTGCHKQEYVRTHIIYCTDNATGKKITFGEQAEGNLTFVYSSYFQRSFLVFESKAHGQELVDPKDLGQCEIY